MSMTRREAAIKSCEDRIRHLESVPPHYYGKRQRGRAIELEKVKIKALRPVSREQVERVRGKWINTNKEVEQMCKCSKCGYPISYFWSRTPFCPNCGAPMTDEAVDIRLKELEALNDGKGD
ncbi:zinc ribbon domain-containing protein [Flavonifractor plautii]|uniref:zinc ribbon domain-containing protein n=1 Tax=Flavonifractor plautii TaxID=292800 RepID=UPI00195A8C2A|nr:zinc ribbon domain-containing protein [Flavonifractor plautii]MBM6792175.1 zinc ribbon domain-containing protein [Flavonifractor plautii]